MILFWTYVALGPLTWLVCLYLTLVGRERTLKLRKSKAQLPANAPLVTILVPAKDEGSHIETCLRRVLEQDYPNFEVIAINDRSSDDTGATMDRLAQSESRLRVVHVTNLPDGWLGKCHALYQGTQSARGEWLFFVDSDVQLVPSALRETAALAIERQYDAVSILTRVITEYFIEKLMLPLLAGTWAALFKADQTNEDSEPELAVANGQFFLIRGEVYRKTGGHEAVKDRIVEDVELMRLLKKSGYKTRLFAGKHLASTRMHTHLKQMFHGWARIYAGTSRGSIWPMVGAILFMIVSVLSVYPALGYAVASHSPQWLVASGVHFGLVTALTMLIFIWSGNSPIFALLLPLSVPIEIAILAFSIHRARTGKVHWRGSEIHIKHTAG